VASLSRLRSSTAESESKPSSLNLASAWIAAGEACPRTVAACSRTRSISTRSRSAGGQRRQPVLRPAARRSGGGGAAGTDPQPGRPSTSDRVPLAARAPRRPRSRRAVTGRVAERGGRVEEGHALVGGERDESGAGDPGHVDLVEFARHVAALVQNSPGQRGGGQTLGVPVVGEGVEEDVGRGVVALPGVAQGAHHRGVEDEVGQVRVPGEFVQVPGRVDLGPQDVGEPLGGERADESVVEDARGCARPRAAGARRVPTPGARPGPPGR